MCAGALLHARLKRVVFGAPDPKTGAAGSVLNLFSHPQLNHQTVVQGGVLVGECGTLLQDFFQAKRESQRRLSQPVREDALRTPEDRFMDLRGYPWTPRYLSDLPALAGCLRYQGASPSVALAEVPAAGAFYWYLVTGTNGSGEGTAGNATAGARVVNTSGVCP